MQEDLLARERELLHWQANRLEAVGMLARGIAHDFNNILSGMLGFASFLRSKAVPGSALARDLALIEQAGQQGVALAQTLSWIARRRHGTREPVDVVALLSGLVAGLQAEASRDVRIDLAVRDNVAPAWGDPSQLRIAFRNVLKRAVASIGDRPGRVEVMIECRPLAPEEEAILVHIGGPLYVYVAITDTGHPMSEEMRMHLFDPFYLARTSREGPGLDMTVAYCIVANHLGNVYARPSSEHGNCIGIYLPVYEKAVLGRVPEERLLGGSETILVVDDEGMIREMLSWLLETKGYHVIAAASGEEALDIFRQEGERIDLVLLDLLMPGLGGEETFYEIRKIRGDVPVLLTSIRMEEDLADRLIARGAAGIVYKPYRSDALLAAVRRALARGP